MFQKFHFLFVSVQVHIVILTNPDEWDSWRQLSVVSNYWMQKGKNNVNLKGCQEQSKPDVAKQRRCQETFMPSVFGQVLIIGKHHWHCKSHLFRVEVALVVYCKKPLIVSIFGKGPKVGLACTSGSPLRSYFPLDLDFFWAIFALPFCKAHNSA